MTTRIRTSGGSRPTRSRSRTASAPDAFVLTLWTSDPALAARADAAGIDRIGVDLERLGKAERQRGLGTWVSPHTLDDLARVGATAALIARAFPTAGDLGAEVARARDRLAAWRAAAPAALAAAHAELARRAAALTIW
jgi:hypothetical protein